jgi:AcrR family transcriptional regulator
VGDRATAPERRDTGPDPTTPSEPRERVMRAAMAAITERGLYRMRMTHLAELAGMSPSHILYYFSDKETVLIETLRWSEALATAYRREVLRGLESAGERLLRFIELTVPVRGDPAVILWLEVWARAPFSEEVQEVRVDLERPYLTDLAEVVAYGIRRGEFAPVDPDEFADRFSALLDGYILRTLAGDQGCSQESMTRIALQAASRELGFRPGPLIEKIGRQSSTSPSVYAMQAFLHEKRDGAHVDMAVDESAAGEPHTAATEGKRG